MNLSDEAMRKADKLIQQAKEKGNLEDVKLYENWKHRLELTEPIRKRLLNLDDGETDEDN